VNTGHASTVARGRRFEEAAERFLQQQGLKTVTKNFRCKVGEIDLVMNDRGTLAFVEVRYRARGGLVAPFETITHAKQQRIVLTAAAFLQARPTLAAHPCRFDAIAVDGREDALCFDWIKDAFSA